MIDVSDVGISVERVLIRAIHSKDYLKVAGSDIIQGSQGIETWEEN